MTQKNRVLVVSKQDTVPEPLAGVLAELNVTGCVKHPNQAANWLSSTSDVNAAVLALESAASLHNQDIRELTERLRELAISTLVLTDEAIGKSLDDLPSSGTGLLHISRNESSDMLKGRLVTLLELQPQLQRITMSLDQPPPSDLLRDHFDQVGEEMQLAARLQRDFLPQQLPQVPAVEFAVVFRPASWVSGDIYDVMQLDEDHVGFYIADAMGHGLPAALMTMFIKRALVTKTIKGHDYRLIEPGEALERLNRDLAEQELSNFQFATCCYARLNVKTLELRVACGGHPPPMRIDKDGQVHELRVAGSLMGVFEDLEYATEVCQLAPGDKLLIYSDGVEEAFVNEGADKPLRFRREFGNLRHYDIESMCAKFVDVVESQEGSLHPRDDMTILGVQVKDQPPA